MTPSSEHLVHAHVAEQLAAATAHRARRADVQRPEPSRAAGTRRILPTLLLPLHPTKKGTPA